MTQNSETKSFRIEWRDPDTGARCEEIISCVEHPDITAREVAEDVAYNRAEKGWYRVTEVKA